MHKSVPDIIHSYSPENNSSAGGITMSDLLKKIYNEVLVYEQDVVNINLQVYQVFNQFIASFIKLLLVDKIVFFLGN